MKLGELICCIFSCASALKMAVSFLNFVLTLGFFRLKVPCKKEEDCAYFLSSHSRQNKEAEVNTAMLTKLC